MPNDPYSIIVTYNLITPLFQVYSTEIIVETVILADICCFNAFLQPLFQTML